MNVHARRVCDEMLAVKLPFPVRALHQEQHDVTS